MKKKTTRNALLLFSCLLSASLSYGEVNVEEMGLAINVLKGKDTIRSKEWAIGLLEASQEEEPNAYVKNVLGISYLHGIGTDADTARAVMNLEQAGEMGYVMAFHNLGMFYKYAEGGKQDFGKAYNAFSRGAERGHPNCCYDCGYMLYKGLGCKQSYEDAISLFQKSAERNHPGALYMLGLCYRNGYGVEADTAIANFYLRQSSNMGLKYAMEELLNEEAETEVSYECPELVEGVESPEEMPTIVPYLPANNTLLEGKYNGLLVTYDWSGNKVVSEKPLSVDMTVNRDSVFGIWMQGNDTIPFAALITDDGIIRFSQTVGNLYDRYADEYHASYRFDQADLNYRRGIITGQLRLYALEEREPERPMFVSLVKDNFSAQGLEDDAYNSLYAYSDPYSDRIVLKFELAEAVPSVTIAFFTKTGLKVRNYKQEGLDAGVHTLSINSDLENGFYTIRVNAGNQKYQTIIVK